MRLVEALRLSGRPSGGNRPPACVAFTGAGGKTTALFQLARQLLDQQNTVVVSTSTHLSLAQAQLAGAQIEIHTPEAVEALFRDLPPGLLFVHGGEAGDQRIGGPGPEVLSAIREACLRRGIDLLLEADGSRMKPLKAPADHEPALPPWVTTVVVTAGLSGLGRPLTADWVHRPERFAALSGANLGEPVSVDHLSRMLLHPQGGLKATPAHARRMAMLNQVDSPEAQGAAQRLAKSLVGPYAAVLLAQLDASNPDEAVPAVYERVAGVILAAGESRRLGKPKQLLDWKGEPFARRVARTAVEAGLSPVVLVTGAWGEEVRATVQDLPVEVVENPDWAAGQSTSIRAGVSSLPAETGAALFLLVDQPQTPAGLLRSLVAVHRRTLAPLVAPLIDGQRGNPVLFDRALFPELLQLSGDRGGRALFSRHPVEWLPWHDPSLLLDVDTPEDYERLLKQAAAEP